MDADKREEIKDLVRMMHAELVKECPIRADIALLCTELKLRWWKLIALFLLAAATGGGASEIVSGLKMAATTAHAAGVGP